jgi:hypothetical protein
MLSSTLSVAAAVDRLRDLGCSVTVSTRPNVTRFKAGEHVLTVADKVRVEGIRSSEDPGEVWELVALLKRSKPQALAVISVTVPPVRWLRVLVGRYRSGWRSDDGRRITLDALAANVCAFVVVDPLDDEKCESIARALDEALG